MPPMPVTDQQVSDIAAYLHVRAAEALSSAHVPRSYAVEKWLTGNIKNNLTSTVKSAYKLIAI